MKISIPELFQLIDAADTVGRQSAIATVAESTIPDGYVLVPADSWVIAPGGDLATVAGRLGIDEDDLIAAFAEVDNT